MTRVNRLPVESACGGRALLLAVLCALASSANAGGAREALAALRWEQRVLLVFAGDEPEPAARQRRWLAADPAALAERALLAVTVSPDTPESALPGALAGVDAPALRRHFGVAPDRFRVILLGLDGGVKLESDVPVAPCALFARIDAMPMRRAELRRAGAAAADCGAAPPEPR